MKTDKIILTSDELKFGINIIEEMHLFNNIKNYDEAIQLISYKFNEGFYSKDEFKILVELEKKYWNKIDVEEIKKD